MILEASRVPSVIFRPIILVCTNICSIYHINLRAHFSLSQNKEIQERDRMKKGMEKNVHQSMIRRDQSLRERATLIFLHDYFLSLKTDVWPRIFYCLSVSAMGIVGEIHLMHK